MHYLQQIPVRNGTLPVSGSVVLDKSFVRFTYDTEEYFLMICNSYWFILSFRLEFVQMLRAGKLTTLNMRAIIFS